MTAPLSPEREAAIVARLDDENRTASELTDIVTELLAEVDRLRAALKDAADQVAERDDEIAQLHCLRAELAALPAPVVETAFRDALGNVWPVGHFPAETEALVLKTTPTIQRTVRISEWTEVTS